MQASTSVRSRPRSACFVPIPITALIVPVALAIVVFQIWGSYRLIARVFKWLTLTLLAYIGSAFFAKPDLGEVLRGTFVPALRLDRGFLMTLVAILGTTISPYLFFWQASQEVEEEVERGRRRVWQRRGATRAELHDAAWDVYLGMFFSNVVMYFIILATAATLFKAGRTGITSAIDAAQTPAAARGQCRRDPCSPWASSDRGSWRCLFSPARPHTRSPRRSAGGLASMNRPAAHGSSTG